MPNTDNIRQVLDQIEAQPQAFYMGTWEGFIPGDALSDPEREYYDPASDERHQYTECGTTRCVAGWAVYFEAERRGMNLGLPLSHLARDLAHDMGIPDCEEWGPEGFYEVVGLKVLGLGREDRELFYRSEEVAVAWLRRLIQEGDSA